MRHNKRLYNRPVGHPTRLGAAYLWLIILLGISGSAALVEGAAAQKQLAPTQDVGQIIEPKTPLMPKQPDISTQPKTPTFLPYSEPTDISLPSVGIGSILISVGKKADGTMEVPTYPNFDKAAWYRHSPAPGQYGAAVIVGHVDSYANNNGASVFFNLSKLKLNDPINIKRADGITASFSVRAVRDYGKSGLPHDIIYGPVTDAAELRLITCGGKFNPETGSYDNNTVVFATLRP